MEQKVLNSNDDLSDRFNKASTFFTSVSEDCATEELLQFYSLYKQSVEGQCNISRPGFFDLKGKQKWDSWKALGNMTKEQSMNSYIQKLTEKYPTWEEDAVHMKSSWVSVSRMLPHKDLEETDKTLFHFVQENNLNKIHKFSTSSLQMIDENKMTALHWACDRGYLPIIDYLIANGVDVNFQDNEGQTPLHYASSCGHEDAVRLLLNNGAKKGIADCDGSLPYDVAETEIIKEMLCT